MIGRTIFPTINHSGADELVEVACIAEPARSESSAGPATPCNRFAELIRRTNEANKVRAPPPVTLTTEPEIDDCDLAGSSYELAVVIAYFMALYGPRTNRKIFATGRLPAGSGNIGAVEEFERKVDLVSGAARRGSYFIYPKDNATGAVRRKLQRLSREYGVKCIPVSRFDEIRFLWTSRAIFRIKVAAAAAAVFCVFYMGRWLVTPSPVPILQPGDTSEAALATSINTGPKSGAYQNALCPNTLAVLAREKIPGRYPCTPSNGTRDSIHRLIKGLGSLGFVQQDVYITMFIEEPEVGRKLDMIVEEIACEGLWGATKNPKLATFGGILKSLDKTTLVLPPEDSGSAATFEYLRINDTEFKPVQDHQIRHAKTLELALDDVRSGSEDDDRVAFFIQYILPDDLTIKKMKDKGLALVPVKSDKITELKKRDGLRIYGSRSFPSMRGIETACVKVGLIARRPETFGEEGREAQEALITALKKRRHELNPEKIPLARFIDMLTGREMNTGMSYASGQ
jgi:hypothetical protein